MIKNRISVKVEIKPGVFRNVHITDRSNKAGWVVTYNGKLVAVAGTVSDGKFVANEKYKHIVDAYIPKRKQYKASNVSININFKANYEMTIAKNRELNSGDRKVFLPNMEIRTVRYNSVNSCHVSYKNKPIYGKVLNGNIFVPNDKEITLKMINDKIKEIAVSKNG